MKGESWQRRKSVRIEVFIFVAILRQQIYRRSSKNMAATAAHDEGRKNSMIFTISYTTCNATQSMTMQLRNVSRPLQFESAPMYITVMISLVGQLRFVPFLRLRNYAACNGHPRVHPAFRLPVSLISFLSLKKYARCIRCRRVGRPNSSRLCRR